MNKLATIALAAALSFSALHLARADKPGPDWMPVQHVVEQVLKSGYTQVTKIEAEDGRWEGEGIKNGQKMAFQTDPKTGVITSENLDQPGPDWMTAQQVIEQVLKSGYTQVTKIEADSARWKGEGFKNGQRTEFHADPKTGVITSEKLNQLGDWMPAQQVIEQVLKLGYTQVTKLEADGDQWEGEGIKNGQKMEFHADPKTGVITTEKLDD
jgi:hypothetical protein